MAPTIPVEGISGASALTKNCTVVIGGLPAGEVLPQLEQRVRRLPVRDRLTHDRPPH